MNTELVCVMASLGYSDADEYYKGVDCIESLKDMIKFLRYEDKTCDIRRQMGEAQVLRMDLLPLLTHFGDDRHLADIVLRLLVNLTSPVDVCMPKLVEGEKATVERESHILEITTHLQQYKEAFTDKKVMATIAGLIAGILDLQWEERQEEDTLFLERILLTLRNILHVPSNPDVEKRTDDDVSIHDQVLWNIHDNAVDDLLLYIASSPDEQQWSFHALEIISHMLREQNPEKLAKAGESMSETERNEDSKMLQNLLQAEMEDKKAKVKKFSSRHSNFGGSFWVPGIKALNKNNPLVYHRTLASAKDITLDFDKNHAKKNRAKIAVEDRNTERNSILSIRLFLKNFCRRFLELCYNPLMEIIKDKLTSKKTQENDETYYLWCLRFFMAFNRALELSVEYVGVTFNLQEFEYVLSLLHSYFEMYTMKQSPPEWSKRLHVAIQAYKELLMTVFYLEKSKNAAEKSSAKVIQSNIFYIEEYRTVFLKLITKYNKAKMPRSALKDIVEAFHLFLKMLERFAGDKELLVEQKKRQTRKKKKTTKKTTISYEAREELWDDFLGSALSGLLQGRDGEEVREAETSPFDALSEVPMDEQRELAKAKIQQLLVNRQHNEAVALLRAARDVWPDHAEFGTTAMSPEEEFMCIRGIYFMELEGVSLITEDDEVNEEEEEVDEIQNELRTEKSFTLKKFLFNLADASIMQPYIYLLGFYTENTEHTNHCIAKMLHRVAVDLKTPAMLFQLSVFLVFKKILFDRVSEHYKELRKLATFILSKFFELATEKPMVFVELLSWKSPKECYELVEGYGSLQDKSEKKREKWSFEEEEELRTLYYQFKEGEDVLEQIMTHITDKERTERQIVSKLVRLKLVPNARAIPRPKQAAWNPEKDDELRSAFEVAKDDDDPLGCIVNRLSFDVSKRKVSKRLLELRIVLDRKELRKKRKKGKGKRNSDKSDQGFMANHEDNSSEDEIINEMPRLEEEGSEQYDSSSSDENEASDPEVEGEVSDNDLDNITSENGQVNEEDFSLHCNAVIDNGMMDQVKWLQKKLLSIAQERELQDEWHSTPLVTITAQQQKAFTVKKFKKLLKAAGIRPPSSHEETFWRLPDSITPTKLRALVKVIEAKATVKDLPKDNTREDNKKSAGRDKGIESEDGSVSEVDTPARNEDDSRGSQTDGKIPFSDNDSDEEISVVQRHSRKRNRALSDDEDSESDDDIALSSLLNKRPRNDGGKDNSIDKESLAASSREESETRGGIGSQDTDFVTNEDTTSDMRHEHMVEDTEENGGSLELRLTPDKDLVTQAM